MPILPTGHAACSASFCLKSSIGERRHGVPLPLAYAATCDIAPSRISSIQINYPSLGPGQSSIWTTSSIWSRCWTLRESRPGALSIWNCDSCKSVQLCRRQDKIACGGIAMRETGENIRPLSVCDVCVD